MLGNEVGDVVDAVLVGDPDVPLLPASRAPLGHVLGAELGQVGPPHAALRRQVRVGLLLAEEGQGLDVAALLEVEGDA